MDDSRWIMLWQLSTPTLSIWGGGGVCGLEGSNEVSIATKYARNHVISMSLQSKTMYVVIQIGY